MKKHRRKRTTCLAVVSILGVANAAPAADGDAGSTDPRAGTDVLPTVQVTGEAAADTGYVARGTTGIGRNDIDEKDLARSVQVINRVLIEDVQPRAIEDVLTYSSNVIFLGDQDARENTFIIRGFQDAPVLRDGFRVESFGGISDPEIYNLERLEVLKGPDSVVYGESDPGGLINMVSKRPLDTAHAEMVLDAGSFGSVSPKFDVGSPLNADGSLRARAVGVFRHDEGWRDYDSANQRLFLAPTASWDITGRTTLTFVSEFTRDDNAADFGVAVGSDGELVAPTDRVNNHPQDTIELWQTTVGYDLDHAFNDRWKIQNRFRYVNSGFDYSPLMLPFAYDEASGSYLRFAADQEQHNEEYSVQLNLSGDFSLGGIRNRLYSGVDVRVGTTGNMTRFDIGTPHFIDYLDPDYSELPPAAEDMPVFFDNEDDIERYGFYLQDHINLTESLIVSGGLRYDIVDRTTRDKAFGSPDSEQEDDELTPQAGIVYHVNEQVSVHASYSQSFNPSVGSRDASNQPLPAETGEGYEIGTKVDLLDNRLRWSAAAFHITKQNVATADPVDPFASVASGEQRSRGVETDLYGELMPGWSVIASYGYADAEVTADNSTPEGNGLPGVPAHAAALWTNYEFQRGRMAGFGIGGGVRFMGERWLDTANTIELDSVAVLGAALSYKRKDWRLMLHLNNLTDEEYVFSSYGTPARGVHAGAPFEAYATLIVDFK